MDKKYQRKEEMEALVNERINALKLQDILKIGKNLNIFITKWPLDYTAEELYKADTFGLTTCETAYLYK